MSKRVFIVRPFGTQEGIDFDAVEARLIQPAIRGVASERLEGGTTMPIVEQGNIREDMFRELVAADLVIADLSIHNANVFYELGIRHGLRPNATFLLRANASKFPFDLQTDRYLLYNEKSPEDALTALTAALEATVSSARVDSPVYQLLPNLRPPDRAALRPVPREFREAVDCAWQAALRGDLRLLAHEARDFPWNVEGLRTVGRAQFDLSAIKGAVETFEWLRELRPDDVEANQRLATLYQRWAKQEQNPAEYLAKSNVAIQRVIESPLPSSHDMAEAYALKARNVKTRWLARLRGKTGADAQLEALRAPELEESLESYASGFLNELNHFYPGVNALSLLRIRIDLARAQPDVWASFFENDTDAAQKLKEADDRLQQLAAAVKLSIEASRLELARQQTPDAEKRRWTEISAADLAFCTGTRPPMVAQRYRQALAGAPAFAVDAVRDQIEIFQQLGVRPEFVTAALAAVADGGSTATGASAQPAKLGRLLLFTGHMIDAPDRTEPRFPPTPQAELEARRMIKEAVMAERALETESLAGIAGAACGGDILFHEVCAELGIPTTVFLAVPKEEFIRHSVQHGGPQWVERFNRLLEQRPSRVLADSTTLPAWLRAKKDYTIWQRNNLWMLFNSLSLHPQQMTLISLWDQGAADGPGGTRDLVNQVRARGFKIERLPAERLKTLVA
jgi:hypothetical protein